MKQYFSILLITLLALTSCDSGDGETSHPDNREVRLQSTLNDGWQLFKLGKVAGVPVKVPGVVQENLMNTGGAQNPFYRMQEEDMQWVSDTSWEYRLITPVSDNMLAMDKVNLVFEGLDTYAEVYLNDSLILRGDNMFKTYKIDVKSLLRKDKNKLQVIFTPPSKYHKKTWVNKKYELPAGNDAGEEKVSVYTRKAGYHFGWDWSPRLVTMGIWRPVYFEGLRASHITDVAINQGAITEDKATMELLVDVESDIDGVGELAFYLDATKTAVKVEKVDLHKGNNQFKIPLDVSNPELWWPNGYGDQRMYKLQTQLSVDGSLVSSNETSFGVRSIELVQEKDSIGKSFYFKVNGVPIFMKGANYIPQDNFLSRVEKTDYEHLIAQAKAANMNMLRVWGGGVYEDDWFYELCDINGILVWQDFMFACSMYPGDEAFVANVEDEVKQNVRRLQNHPSIALWCGNNEMDVAWHNWGWQEQYNYSAQDSAEIWDDYQNLFHNVIPVIVDNLNGSRPYVTTSPLSNWGTPENFNNSSMHYWGVWHGREPFENYQTNVGRFMSEYGFQSFPEMETIRTFATDEDLDLNSDVMKHHQKSYIGNDLLMEHLTTYFPKPKSFEDFVYLSQLSQAHGMEMAITSHRLKKGHCMGTLYWQLNDCWPGPSWSSIDFEGNWKKLHYSVRELYAPMALLISKDKRNFITFAVVSDGPNTFEGNVALTMLNLNGDTVMTMSGGNVNISSDTVVVASRMHTDKIWDRRFSPTEHVLRAELKSSDGKVLRTKYYHGTEAKNLKLKDPKIAWELTKADSGFECKITCESYASNVFVKVNDYETVLPDNYFDLWPGETKTITFKTTQEINEFKARLTVKTLNDTF